MNGTVLLSVLTKVGTLDQSAITALDAAIATKQPLPAPFDKIPVDKLPYLESALKLFLVGDEIVQFMVGLTIPAAAK